MSFYLFTRYRRIFCALGVALLSASVQAQQTSSLPASLSNLPATIDNALTTFHTPGMAVGIIKDDKIVYLAGHGLRDIKHKLPVTPDTYFRLASTSKAFTAASVALLVDNQQLSWQDKVSDVLPGFKMQQPWVTDQMMIIDLLTHRSGLASGAGDSMIWPEPGGFSREEIIHNLRYLTPASSFRSAYAYSNVMYITAGEVVAEVAKQPWDQFIASHLFGPLGMQCYGGDVPQSVVDNSAISYGYNDKKGTYAIPRNALAKKGLVSAAAGGVSCNAREMLKWLQMWLHHGALPNGDPLLASETVDKIFTPQTILPISDIDETWDQTQFRGYGLGWRISDVLGRKVISHTGTLSGYQAYVAMIPSLNVGVVLLNNGSDYGARGSVMQTILKGFMPEAEHEFDWIAAYEGYQQEQEHKYLARHTTPKGNGEVILDPIAYAGLFADQWFGEISIKMVNGKLRLQSAKMPTLAGSLEPFEDHTFVVRWDNQNAASDAFIHFTVNTQHQVTGFTMTPFTDKVPSYHEYSDMVFARQDENHK